MMTAKPAYLIVSNFFLFTEKEALAKLPALCNLWLTQRNFPKVHGDYYD